MSRGKKRMKLLVFTLHFWFKRSCGKIIIKVMINTLIQIRDKTANATQDQIEFER